MRTGAGSRTLYVALDACDLTLAQRFAAEGSMPTLARLLDDSASQETLGPLGFLVGSNWVTIYTGVSPSRHQFLCSGQIRGGTYQPAWVGPYGGGYGTEPPVWKWVSDAGGRVAVLDAPHAAVATELNGVQLVEWGCHDRHAGTRTFPESLLEEINATYGPHLPGTRTAPFPHHAPCDVSHRSGEHRTTAENQTLLDEMLEGVRQKTALSRDLLDQGGWDLFFTVFGESHCAGHQFWKVHDETHPWHDPEEQTALGGDPLRAVYSALDAGLGELIDHAGDDATVYVHLSHGMRAHYDGTCVLDPVLWRIDEYASRTDLRGRFTRLVDNAANALPRPTRRRALSSLIDVRRRLAASQGAMGTDGRTVDIPAWLGERRWWMQPNDSVFGSVRLNLDGREPDGRIRAARKREVAEWLAERLLELINVDTGEQVVAAVHVTDDHYERFDGDPLGDLIVEWNRDAPIDTVWSPATGVVTAPYKQWRTGDHHRGGLLLARGRGIAPGRRPGSIPVFDVAPTLAASLGVEPPAIDGIARVDLLPAEARTSGRPSAPLSRPLLSDAPVRPSGRRPYSRTAFDVRSDVWLQRFAVGLSQALHAAHSETLNVRDQVGILGGRVTDVERLASIAEVAAWLDHVELPESLLVSVVLPTRNRADLIERAVDSVRRQSYSNWELLVVDDASTDDTAARLRKMAENDPRIRPFTLGTPGRSSVARNHALDRVNGDVVVYLDDDNRLDPDWLRAVVWAFTEYPETQVAYGARVVDDDVRHQGYDGRSMPIVQFLAWDRDAMMRSNIVDQNVIAHRPSAVRFDESIDHFSDWDLMLQLTDDCDPLELPAIAVHYYSDRPDRVTVKARGANAETAIAERVLRRARERRAGA
ncbi:MAG TPA: glycosyltransferase [Acidimicrobiia bacterium]|nr:glycosyltransferase [Acidimicrobiia bacterium]